MRASFFPLLFLIGEAAAGGTNIYSITPTQISNGGGVIFIDGHGFSADNFNFHDPILGNKIWFFNDFETLVCDSPVKKNWLLQNPQAPSTTRVVCSLPARQSKQGSDWYTMKLTVDGEEAENAGQFMVRFDSGKTPTLRKIDHRYGAPGDMVTITGKIFTKNIGPGASDLDNFDELDTRSLQNIFFGTANCGLMDELGHPWGAFMASDGQWEKEGNITCQTSGSFVGPQNATLLVSEYGQSVIDKSAYSVNSKGQAFFYHTLPEVSSVSPNTGADMGGTFLTLEGKGFDGYEDNTQVFINDALCENVEVTSTKLTCKTPAESSVGSGVGGPRGMKYNLWVGEVVDEAAIGAAVDALSAGDSEEFIVDQGFIDTQMSAEESDYTGKLSGLFIAPNTGNFSFAICANDAAELYLGTSGDSTTKALVANRTEKCDENIPDGGYGDKIELMEGEVYYIEAVHIHRDSVASNTTNFLQISFEQTNTYLTPQDLDLATSEYQGFYVQETRVLEKQKITFDGVAGAELTLTHNGIPSQSPVFSDDDVSTWSENIDKMFTWQCTRSQTRFKLINDMEDSEFKFTGQGGAYWQHGVNFEPYCGKSALSKPYGLLALKGNWQEPGLDISGDAKWFCFAHKGTAFYNGIDIHVKYGTTHWQTWGSWVNIPVEGLGESKDEWAYQCVDLEEGFLENKADWITHWYREGSPLQLTHVNIAHDSNLRKDGFLDEVSFGSKANTIERIAPAFANSASNMEEVIVNSTAADSVEIEFNPYTCHSEEETFSLMGIAGATIDEMTSSATGAELAQEQIAFLKTADKATFSVGGGKVIVERLSKESPKMEGTYSLTLNGKSVDVDIYNSWFDLQDIYENEFGLLGVEVKNKYWDTCYKFSHSIEYKYIGGDQPEVQVDDSNVINHGEADSVRSNSWTSRNGGVKIIQPGGDFFRQPTEGSDPQVTVWVNGFLSLCAGGADCSFSYDASLTPTITGVSDALVDGFVELTIAGSGFTTDETDFTIDVGGRKCVATAATATSVTCTLENGPAGDFDISLWVQSRGKASGSVTFTLSLAVDSFSPTSGSVGGGTTLTILGTGFPNTMAEWDNNEIAVGGSPCKITETSYTEVTCITPKESTSRRRKRALADLTVTVNGQTASAGSQYNYDASSTPTISTLDPVIGTPTGGETLTITGTTFDYESPFNSVTIGEDGAVCEIITWTPTEITCTMPALSNGQHTVYVMTKDNGMADASGVSPIMVDFTVTGASPLVGSHQGGTKIKIAGSGFGDCSNVVFNIGSEHTCVVDEGGCTSTEVSCTVTKTATMHVVRNTGRHFKFGPGYVWEPATVTVRPGDEVRWSWNLPVAQEGTGVAVHSTSSPASNEYDGRGFNSQTKTAKGNLVYQFMTEGTFSYNTQDVIEGEDVYMPGKVVVESPSEDEIVAITASIGSITAETVVGGSVTAPTGDGCTFADSSCATSAPGTTSSLEFTFASCLTAEITDVQISSGSTSGNVSTLMGFADSELTISGSGFSTEMCENVVMVGETECAVSSATAATIVCSVDAAAITSLSPLPVTVNIQNNGDAVQKVSEDSAGKLYVVPKIDAISPTTGSWAGGSILTLTGSGLNPTDGIVTINFGELPFQTACAIIEVTSSKVACTVPELAKVGDEKTVVIDIYFSGEMLRAEMADGVDANYTYSTAMTPTSAETSPSEFSTSTSIDVSGTGFGADSSAVSVFLRPSSMSGKRRRRSVASRLEEIASGLTYGYGPKPKVVHQFWKSIKKERPSRSIEWRSAGSSKKKRSADWLPHLTPEDHVDELEELFHPEIEHMHARTVRRSTDINTYGQELFEAIMESEPDYFHRRRRAAKYHDMFLSRSKRSTEEELLEMSMEGATEATVTAVTDTTVTFTAPELPAGTYNVIVYVSGSGNAEATATTLTSQAMADSISPDTGSTFGGQTVVISGNGFSGSMDDTSVDAGGAACEVTAVTASAVTCVTPAGADGSADFVVTSNGVAFPAVAYTYSTASTPTVTLVTPSTGSGAQSLTVSGSNFGAAPTVSVGDTDCSVTGTTSSPDTISCDLPAVPGGDYAVVVSTSEYGVSNNDVTYTSELTASSISPTTGSFGGGSLITITGTGFDTNVDPTVTVCTDECAIQSVTDSEITCLAPANAGSGTESCDVTVSQVSGASVVAGSFTYDDALTPQVTGVSPQRGGTGGGTSITITGTGFASSGNKVMVDGSICDITAESSTSITCLTNSHDGCIEVPVTVDVPGQGYGQTPDDGSANFYYIDRWNSIWTWGGTGTPLAGELIHITEGQTILLDTSTPVLKMLLIDGGKLMYDRDANGLNLQSEYILIINGGALEIGTEDDRYLNEASITMHGNVRCTELPIYGCKTIGVRDGSLDLHGEFIPMTWTYLAETAAIGDTDITLKNGVNWKPGSEIIIATTGGRASMGESEKKVIDSVSADGTVITLTEPLKFEHLSIMQTFGSHDIETRAEVGLLSRNIKVKGTVNEQFVTEIPACEKPFVANEEATQSCFHGKFGEEIGTDEMGAIIFIHAKEIDKHLVTARISYTEFNEVGQAFRVGRYPIHFHINGNVTGSYVRGNAIHHSYNRACTIHAVNHLLVEHNVVYDIKGLSFFVEDGVEEENTLQYNLAVYTRQSNSLLNPDIQPGSFWIVNPNNYVQHNAVAGSTHFGFWYRVLQNPDGPSRTNSFCPAGAPMGRFYNNSAHSNGLYGIWLFTAGEKGWVPRDGTRDNGYCSGNRITATFGDFTAWNNEIGVEIVEGGAIRFENMTLLDNEKSGIEIIHATGAKRQNGEEYGAPTFKNSVVVAHSKLTENWENGAEFCTKSGVWSGWWGNDVENVEFYNFDRPTCAALTNCARCKPKWGASKTQTSGLSFTNSPNKVSWKWIMAGHFHDLDGTLCGTPDCKVVHKRDIYDPAHCTDDTDDEFSHIWAGKVESSWLDLGLMENDTIKMEGYVCDDTMKFHTVGFNAYAPTSLQFNDVVWHNEFGSTHTPWRKKPPYKDGWTAVLPEGTTNFFFWNTLDHITNITYKMGAFQMADEGDHLILGHNFTQSPDVFTFNGEESNSSVALAEPPTYDTAGNTEWYWSGNDTKEVIYILSNKDKTTRKKRGGKPTELYREIQFRVYRCLYAGCLPPPPPTVPAGRPLEFLNWSSEEDWESLDLTKPVAGADGIIEEWVTIPPGVWMVLDENPPPMIRLMIYGVLEIADEMDMTLSAEIIMIQGDTAQLVAGTADAPYQHNFDLILMGNHETEDQPLPDGPNLGAKALGVFGMLQLHGKDVGRTWTRLAQDAMAGDNTIVLSESVDPMYWTEGAEIIIAPTGFEPMEKEKMTIASIDGNTITLNDTLQFTHLGSEYSLEDGSRSWNISAEVGLLSRNIRVIGQSYAEIGEEQFGARVLVSKFTQEGTEYRGYAKISNVEFVRGGQEGWTDAFDPRYALAFLNHEDSIDNDEYNKESYVKKCAFNYNYNAALGLFNTNNVLVEDNVVFRTMEYGIRDEGIGNRFIHNLVVLTRFVGIHKDHRQNFYKRGCFYFKESLDPEFRDNAAAGCERAGFAGTGHICTSNKRWSNNVIHTTQDGIFTNTFSPPVEVRDDKECVVFRGFFVYKAYDYAFYLLTHDTVEMEDNIIVDSGVGIHPFLISPRPTTHELVYKHLRINNTLFVGRNDPAQCDTDVEPSYLWFDKERNKGATMWPGRNWKGYATGHAGLLWPIFSGIGVPLGKPWVNGKPKSFPLLTGQVYLNDNTFANFNPGQCGGQFDSAIRTNPRGDDMQFPIIATGTKFINVADSSKIWMDRPIIKLVSNEHCVDMHCDGLKKALLIDTDGEVIGDGEPGTIIADSAYEWEGNPSAGLGYYRVPKTMVTEVNGDKIEYEDKMPNTGIVRNDRCSWVEEWHAYKCHDLNHRLMILESMDIDTLDRRLSPVAVLANPGPDGYIDLINGPQDWSCCFGYACQKRVSNFYSIVATNMMYEIQLTSTPPIHMRYRLKNNEGGDPVLLKIYFPKPQRIDIFVGDRFVSPNNIDLTSDTFAMLPPDDSYIPKLTSQIEGENYFDPTTGYLYLLLHGTEPVDYKIQPSVVTKVGASIDIDNFFEGDVAGNIAALLGIDPANIRVTNVVREGRKKRFAPTWDSSEDIVLEMTIEPPPLTNLSETTTVGGGQAMNITELKGVVSDLTNKFQDGSIGDVLGINVTSMATNEPIYVPTAEDMVGLDCIPQDDDPDAYCYFGPEDNAVTGVSWAEASQANASQRLEENLKETALQQPVALRISTMEPFAGFEMTPFTIQPALFMVDKDDKYVSEVGTEFDPWVVTAALVDGAGSLINNVTCNFIGGMCQFENLAIDMMGDNYTLQFDLTYPTTAQIVGVTSQPFNVGGRPLSVKFTGLNTLNPEHQPFTAVVSIWDDALDEPAGGAVAPPAVSCSVTLVGASGVTLAGTTEVAVTDGVATFDDLQITGMAVGAQLVTSCKDDQDFMHMGTSDDINVHPFPRTGNLKDAKTAFTYNGNAKNVGKVLNAFANAIQKEGGSTRVFDWEFAEEEETEEDSPAPVTSINLTERDFASWPISVE